MRKFGFFILFTVLQMGSGWLSAQNNVLLIIADDLGVDYLESYDLGSDFAPTPVLNALAEDGVVFTNAWTNPICSPSRANMLTGKYGFRTGIGTAITGLQNTALDTSEYTVAKAVKYQTGAETALIGKWHLGHSSQAFKRNPNACGFDRYAGNVEGQLSNYSAWTKTTNGSNSISFNYATTEAVDDAIDWVGGRSGNWLLVMSFNAPHVPFHKPPNDLHSFDNLSGTSTDINNNPVPYFKAMVEAMDTEIGRFLAYLQANDLYDNTDIIFIGDNGTDGAVVRPPFDPNHAKATMYNGGVQVPVIISGPSVVNPGRQAAELVNSTDLYKTILEMMGGNPAILPTGVAIDSRSILSILNNTIDSGSQRPWIYGDLFKPTTNFKDGKAITDGTFKLIEFDNGNTEFYHIAVDPFETNPLDLSGLSPNEQSHFDFLCTELGTLLDTSFCEIVTGIFSDQISPIDIYPNPVADVLNFQLPSSWFKESSSLTGRIYNSGGALVQSFPLNRPGVHSIPLTKLPSGSYQLVIGWRDRPTATAAFIH